MDQNGRKCDMKLCSLMLFLKSACRSFMTVGDLMEALVAHDPIHQRQLFVNPEFTGLVRNNENTRYCRRTKRLILSMPVFPLDVEAKKLPLKSAQNVIVPEVCPQCSQRVPRVCPACAQGVPRTQPGHTLCRKFTITEIKFR